MSVKTIRSSSPIARELSIRNVTTSKLAGTIYSCQMVVMPLAICIPPELVRVFAGVSTGLVRAAALRGERRRMRKQGEGWCKVWCLAERGEIPSSLALLESLCSLYVFR